MDSYYTKKKKTMFKPVLFLLALVIIVVLVYQFGYNSGKQALDETANELFLPACVYGLCPEYQSADVDGDGLAESIVYQPVAMTQGAADLWIIDDNNKVVFRHGNVAQLSYELNKDIPGITITYGVDIDPAATSSMTWIYKTEKWIYKDGEYVLADDQSGEITELQKLANDYFSNTEQKIKELDKSLKKDSDILFLDKKEIYQRDYSEEFQGYPDIECGNLAVEFEFVPDPSRERADEIVIFEDKLNINLIDKDSSSLLESKEGFNLQQINMVNYNNTDYYMTEEYTGGAHCCYEQRVITCKNNQVEIGDQEDFGDSPGIGSVFVKDGELYFQRSDHRFAYFYLSYASSGGMFYPAFYKYDVNSNKFIDASKEFPDYYQELSEHQDGWLEKQRSYESKFFKGAEELWFYPLIQRLVAGYMEDENEQLLKTEFVNDFKYFIGDEAYEKYHFLFELTANDAEKVYNEAIGILSN